MIVTPGASDRKSKHRTANGINRIREVEILVVRRGLVTITFPNRQETRRRYAICVFFYRTTLSQDITRDLLANEFIKRLITIERIDDPIAILARFANRIVRPIPGSISIPSDIQPMPSPTFTIRRRFQQPIDQASKGALGLVAKEGVDLLGRWRQSCQIEASPSNQGAAVCIGYRRDSRSRGFFFFPLGMKKGIDRSPRPSIFRIVRWNNLLNRLEGPESSRLI